MNCHKCIHHRAIAGDCHLRCEHPEVKAVMDTIKNENPVADLFAKFFGGGLVIKVKSLNQKFNRRGIEGGWCNYPYNFDPIWIENCDGFKEIINDKGGEENE